ncbi:metal-sulfur cluster assembly factor [Opitutales bacterium ASA1]|uniref:metal-sulfur cluster assembly factor n=1 Tax=Congregicoccus parvus TaxID=3081749 RepID=UPI002B2FF3C9|nr:metal-sulfur cluster assembly factor [Opitutales bacterium ASA1]
MPTSTPTPLAEADVLAVLAHVLDPEYGIGLVDLGLIYDVVVSPERIDVSMTLTSMHCPAGRVMLDGVRHAAETVAGGRTVEVALVWDPAWTPDMLSPAARRQLGWAT